MNLYLFKLINGLSIKNLLFDKIMIAFSKYVPYTFMVMIVIVFLLGVFKNKAEYRKIAFNTFVFTLLNIILNYIIGGIYYVDRPFVHNKVNLLVPHIADSSFPSDHATGTMSIAIGLGKYSNLLGRILMVISIIVGFSRVYVGNHYPSDVIGAYILVLITNYLYNSMLKTRIIRIYEKVEKNIIKKLFPTNRKKQ